MLSTAAFVPVAHEFAGQSTNALVQVLNAFVIESPVAAIEDGCTACAAVGAASAARPAVVAASDRALRTRDERMLGMRFSSDRA
jgi:hypothetical protein